MTDRRYVAEPVHVEQTRDRNDKVTIKKLNETKVIKYKKIAEYTKLGWAIVDDN
jgi:hypothetical protein